MDHFPSGAPSAFVRVWTIDQEDQGIVDPHPVEASLTTPVSV